MKTIEALEFRLKLDEDLKRGKTFDKIFNGDPDRITGLSGFLSHKVGNKWLQSSQGADFKAWNES